MRHRWSRKPSLRALHVVAIWCFAVPAFVQFTRLPDLEQGAALLLPLVPAMLVALAYLKSSIFRSILAACVVLPLVGCLLFVGNRPARGGRRAGRRRDGPGGKHVVLVVLDEFPNEAR